MCRKNEKSYGTKEEENEDESTKKSTPSIVIYKQPLKIILDQSFVEEYLAKQENKVDSVPKEPIIVSDAPNRDDQDDDDNDDSVVFVKKVPATRADYKIVRLKKQIAALKKEKQFLQSRIQPEATIELDDDHDVDDDDGYVADNEETMESASFELNELNTSGLNLHLDESWVQNEIKQICADGTLQQVFKEFGGK